MFADAWLLSNLYNVPLRDDKQLTRDDDWPEQPSLLLSRFSDLSPRRGG